MDALWIKGDAWRQWRKELEDSYTETIMPCSDRALEGDTSQAHLWRADLITRLNQFERTYRDSRGIASLETTRNAKCNSNEDADVAESVNVKANMLQEPPTTDANPTENRIPIERTPTPTKSKKLNDTDTSKGSTLQNGTTNTNTTTTTTTSCGIDVGTQLYTVRASCLSSQVLRRLRAERSCKGLSTAIGHLAQSMFIMSGDLIDVLCTAVRIACARHGSALVGVRDLISHLRVTTVRLLFAELGILRTSGCKEELKSGKSTSPRALEMLANALHNAGRLQEVDIPPPDPPTSPMEDSLDRRLCPFLCRRCRQDGRETYLYDRQSKRVQFVVHEDAGRQRNVPQLRPFQPQRPTQSPPQQQQQQQQPWSLSSTRTPDAFPPLTSSEEPYVHSPSHLQSLSPHHPPHLTSESLGSRSSHLSFRGLSPPVPSGVPSFPTRHHLNGTNAETALRVQSSSTFSGQSARQAWNNEAYHFSMLYNSRGKR